VKLNFDFKGFSEVMQDIKVRQKSIVEEEKQGKNTNNTIQPVKTVPRNIDEKKVS
jgi:hypothetical protein